MSDESRRDDHTPLKVRITRAMTPARRPTPLPSFQPTPVSSPALNKSGLAPYGDFPWATASPVETTISSGHAGETTSDEHDVLPLDASKIHVMIKHEMSESSLARVRKAEDI